MKVRAVQDGLYKYYRTAGDVFEVPDDFEMPKQPYAWLEKVSEETPNKMQEAGAQVPVYECPACGYITQRRTKFCPDCGTSAEIEKEEEQREKDRADAIEAVQGKQARPEPKKRGRRSLPDSTSGIVDKDKEV